MQRCLEVNILWTTQDISRLVLKLLGSGSHCPPGCLRNFCLLSRIELWFIDSNKSPTCSNNYPVYYPDVYLQLNMFRAFSRPSSGAQSLQWQLMVLPSYRGDIRAVFVVGPGPTTNTARLSPRYEGKTISCHCSHWAPDDGRENSRNILSCK